ncbi:hypothetical protein LguiA_035560 [Lonicera macranthoides]
MVTKMVLRLHPLTFTFLHPPPPHFFPKPFSLGKPLTLPRFSATTTTISQTLDDQTLPYGPSLHKGHKPHQSNLPKLQLFEEEDVDLFDESNFTRVFHIAALRVPSNHCFPLENRLRGHLLNWPRIRNIARVPGDEVEDNFKDFIKHHNNSNSNSNSDEDDNNSLVSLQRRIYGKAEGDGEKLNLVLYRDKLVKTFNSKGYVNFRNLARLSRPKRRKKREERGNGKKKGIGWNEVYMVEVVVDDESDQEGEDLSGLLGYDFRGRKWRGSTRLLLLDEGYAYKGVEEMPEAIKAVLREDVSGSKTSGFEVVRCKLTLFYKYWQMNEILEALLPEGMIIPSAFETVGHIAHLNLKDEHLPYKKLIAKVFGVYKSYWQFIVNLNVDAIHNDYRTMQLEVLAGNHSLVTTVVENGLRFHVDLAKMYWNSRLGTERQRLLNCFSHKDVVCDVFAGVGPIAVSAARKVKHVYANDLNPHAVEYLEKNCVLNKLQRKVEVFNMDGRRFIDAVFANQTARPITQVVMNLPNDAAEYLDVFKGIFRGTSRGKEITLPKIHVYGFSKAQDPEFDFHERIRIAVSEAAFEVEMRRVRLVAPGKWMLCASFILPERVAFAAATMSNY